VLAAHLELGEDVLVALELAPGIAVEHHAGDVEVGDHLFHVLGDVEGVGLAGRLEDIAALFGDPVVLQVAPLPLEHHAMHRRGMAVAREHAGLAHAQQVGPVALRDVQAERAEPDVLRLRHPDALVLGNGRVDHDFQRRFLGVGVLVGRHPGIGRHGAAHWDLLIAILSDNVYIWTYRL
jgi:hypothetical protein